MNFSYINRWLNSLIKIFLALYLGFALFLFFIQDFIIFPRYLVKEVPLIVPSDYTAEKLTIMRDGVQLEGTLIKPAYSENFPVILAFMGNADNANNYVAKVAATKSAWFLVNYRGYAEQPGSPSEKLLKEDALQWYDKLKKHPQLYNRKIFVLGRSIGTGLAVYVAAQRSVAGVVLITPYDTLMNVAQKKYPFYPMKWLLNTEMDSLSLAPKINVPALFLVAGKDSIIPRGHADALYAAWGVSSLWREFSDMGHNDLSLHPMFWFCINEFIGVEKNDTDQK